MFVSDPAFRGAAGFAAAVLVGLAATRAKALTSGGAMTGIALATICVAAGWTWGLLLFGFFISGSVLTRLSVRHLARQGSGKGASAFAIENDAAGRNAFQVLANGGVLSLAAGGSLLYADPAWSVAGAGAVAAATADTWATEVGTMSLSAPRSIRTGQHVPPGTSGGVSVAGYGAALAGSMFIGLIAVAGGLHERCFLAALAGGVGGCTVDSILGATVQAKRHCEVCAEPTERLVHRCGTTTRHVSGIWWIDNDVVNALGSISGALLALLVV